jgi:toxin ParE1/3/4
VTPTYSYAPEAREELLEAIQYYENESPGLGAAFLAAVQEGLEYLLQFPKSAPILSGKVRRKVLNRFSYSLLYSLRGEEIRILAVMNQKRRPFYWRGRE